MIERQKIDGREATVAYLTAEFGPTEKDDAELVKVIFDDGETIFVATPRADARRDPGTTS